jgi:aquaporin related protein
MRFGKKTAQNLSVHQRTQLPMLQLPQNSRNNLTAVVGEFVGTFLFLFWSFAGTQISNTPKPPDGSNPNPSALLYASLAFGFSLTVNVWAFYRITGGLFNPSVSVYFAIYMKEYCLPDVYGIRLPWLSFSWGDCQHYAVVS